METEKSLEERKTEQLIKLRNYKLIKKEIKDNIIIYRVKDQRTEEKATIWCIMKEDTIGVKYINQMEKMMKEEDLERGVIVSYGRYTHAAQVAVKNKSIELIPRDFPTFYIFDHILVPKHEILTPEEKKELLEKYKVEAYKLPRIKTSDPAIIAIGAKPGDIVRVIRHSPTAGKHSSYRYVVEG